MIIDNNIILTQSQLDAHLSHLYIFLNVMRHSLVLINYNFERDNTNAYIKIDKAQKLVIRNDILHVSRQTFDPVYKTIPEETHIVNEALVFLPFAVFDRFNAFISNFPTKARNSWCKLFTYVYYGYCRAHGTNQGYFLSTKTMSEKLGMSLRDVTIKLQVLEDEGFLTRGKTYSSVLGLSKTCIVPDEMLPDHLKKTYKQNNVGVYEPY